MIYKLTISTKYDKIVTETVHWHVPKDHFVLGNNKKEASVSTESIQMFVGVLSGLVGLAASIPYIPSILRGETRPNRATWFIWTVLGLVTALSYKGVGAGPTVWMAWVFFVNPLITFVLSFKYGVGGWSKLDRFCLAGVLLAAAVWFFSPGWALAMSIAVDLCGLIPTLYKSWHKPEEENLAGWVIITVASVLNLFAIDSLSFGVCVYPVYAALGCGSLPMFLMWLKMARL